MTDHNSRQSELTEYLLKRRTFMDQEPFSVLIIIWVLINLLWYMCFAWMASQI